jgi:hypothetical protein
VVRGGEKRYNGRGGGQDGPVGEVECHKTI